MQCASISFARDILKLEAAHSTEMVPDTAEPIISLMEDQKQVTNMGGTMRLGAYACKVRKNSKAQHAYGKLQISERHRHRYEFNNDYLDAFEKAGMIPSGINPDTNLVEIIELKNHPFYIGTQFHPELKSTVEEPHPLFVEFVKAAVHYRTKQENRDEQ